MALASALVQVIISAVRKTARPMLRDFGEVAQLQVSRKGPGDFVTAADLKAEDTLFELLMKARPGYGFLGEERGLVEGTDDEVDEHYNALFRELLTYMMGDPRTITACTHLLFMAKNLERIGDHATNIAETVHYEITGEEMLGERPKAVPGPGEEQTSTPHISTLPSDLTDD